MTRRPICNLLNADQPAISAVKCRCGRTVCHEGPHECRCGARWGGQLGADGPRTSEISPRPAQPRESAPGGDR